MTLQPTETPGQGKMDYFYPCFLKRFYLLIFFQREGKRRRKRGEEISMYGCLS